MKIIEADSILSAWKGREKWNVCDRVWEMNEYSIYLFSNELMIVLTSAVNSVLRPIWWEWMINWLISIFPLLN